MKTIILMKVSALALFSASAAVPAGEALPAANVITSVYAQGTPIYEYRADAAGKLVWPFRKPFTSIQRLNPQGGALKGACASSGSLTSVPYAADYVFLQDPT